MTIGLDLSVIQTPHRMRGIGSVAINFVRNIPDTAKSTHKFVLYLYEKDRDEALSILKLDGLAYEVRTLLEPGSTNLKLPGKLHIINSLVNGSRRLVAVHAGDPRIQDISGLDAFLQFDPMQPLPRSRKLKKGLVLYDLIPYVMESDYLWSYKTARKRGCSRKGALLKAARRHQYLARARVVSKKANELFAISQHTKDDYVKYAGLKASKIKVVHLGIDSGSTQKTAGSVPFEHYIGNSWGYFPKKIDLEDKPFLLFVGGADPRRKLNDLVAAYNNLKAQGHDIRLVLAGDTMKGPYTIPIPPVQKYIAGASYLEDIAFLGFVTDEQREWLYSNALAMVYPSVYEGFGLPVLEAMKYGTPVITYKNSSITEIAGDAALYAEDSGSITDRVLELINDPKLVQRLSKAGRSQAQRFPWHKTVSSVLSQLFPLQG
jgi:glycosyltransferase involved in cell wall biosynthesis